MKAITGSWRCGWCDMDRGIYINRKSAASLRTPTSTLQFLRCEAAVDHWRKLPADEQAHAALALATGELYQPAEIEMIRFE
jgi:hypothetical protein